MKYGIFADVHGNLEAYAAVLSALAGEGVDKCVLIGDIVGYGADPAPCITKTQELKPIVVCGNHDWAVTGKVSLNYFNPYAKQAVLWTKSVLSDKDKEYLDSLPLIQEFGGAIFVHGSLFEPENFNYILDLHDAMRTFDLLKTPMCFIGHSHAPAIFVQDETMIDCALESKIKINPRLKYIVNVGSVGQPRDGDPEASYCIYDDSAHTVEIKRVAYDVKKAHDKILKAGLPTILATRILEGR